MSKFNNLFLSNNIVLKYNNMLYMSLIYLYGVGKYKTTTITSLFNLSIYKNYNNIYYVYYICIKHIFEQITYNINNFKKKSDLYNKRKYIKLRSK